MQYFEKTYSAIRYAAATILLLAIGVVFSTLSAHPTIEDNTGKDFTEEIVSKTEFGAECLSEISSVGKRFANPSHGANRLPLSLPHLFTPEIDELNKIDLSLAVRMHPNVWNVRPPLLGYHALLTISSFDITDKSLSLLETVVLLN